jgi:magnesium transporter
MSPRSFIRDDQTVRRALVHSPARRAAAADRPPTRRRRAQRAEGQPAAQALLLTDPRQPAAAITSTDEVVFGPDDDGEEAAQAFERYNLVSAPVVDDRNKLLGRVTVEAVMDFNRQLAERRALERAGLRQEEDLFASTWASARNRWPWLCVNLVTAFIASRVIGAFEGTIQQLVALAALMPIVASIGGNTGNQTVAVDQRHRPRPDRGREHPLPHLQGADGQPPERLMWGGLMGLFAWLIYDRRRSAR